MRINSSLFSELCRAVKSSPGAECCGALWSDQTHVVVEYSPCLGPLSERDFRFDDKWWLRVLYFAKSRGKRFAGVYHSHPSSVALYPSFSDRQGHPYCRSLILGRDGTAAAFQLGEPDSKPVSLKLVIVGSP